MFSLLKDNKLSNTGNNIDFLLHKYELTDIENLFLKQNEIKFKRVYELPEEENWKPTIIEELSLFKLGLLETHLEEDEVEFFLEEISTK